MSSSQTTVTIPNTEPKISYYMEPRLRVSLDQKIIPSLHKKDKDCVFIIDGAEGGGKSTLAFQIGRYVDPTLNLDRICFTADSFKEAIFKAKKGQCIIFDEAFTGLSSRSSLSGINRMLVSLMMQMRQKNLMVIIVLPTFFLVDKYVAIFRARALIHVFESRGRRGYYRVYNKKLIKLLYLTGKPTYSYNTKKIRTKFRGRFYGVFALGDEKVDEEYRKKKAKALEETEKAPTSSAQVKYKEQRDLMIYLMKRELKFKLKQMANFLDDYGFSISYVQIRNICGKFGDLGE